MKRKIERGKDRIRGRKKENKSTRKRRQKNNKQMDITNCMSGTKNHGPLADFWRTYALADPI